MTYVQATHYLFDSAPLFQNIGAAAYKEGLANTLALDEHFGHPHHKYRTIHVGGTNGKGSVSHTIAAILQAQGYRVGLYTSPHLIDFRERIRVNGKMISKQRVIDFVEKERSFFEPLHPSFFELATALAFLYFAEQKVDYAVIEVGLGGRLDCTNIIRPVISIITNISFDHVQFLGNTLPGIATEKAGIIKHGIPVCIGENVCPEVKAVFADKAKEAEAPITFAEDIADTLPLPDRKDMALQGLCQEKNARTITASVQILRKQGIAIDKEAVMQGFRDVTAMTGLMGRWQVLGRKPMVICDTAHNAGGLSYTFRHLSLLPHRQLHLVFGMVSDKDIDSVLHLLPREHTCYYFTQASVSRAMPAAELCRKAAEHGIEGKPYDSVASAYAAAKACATDNDIIYIGGSTFVVADMLKSILTSFSMPRI